MTNTHRHKIGARYIDVTLPQQIDTIFNQRNFIRDWFASIPLPPDVKVVDSTLMVGIEARLNLFREAKALGSLGFEEVCDGLFIRFEHALITAYWMPATGQWKLRCHRSSRLCDPSPRALRATMAGLLADEFRYVPKGLGVFYWGLAGFVVGVILLFLWSLFH